MFPITLFYPANEIVHHFGHLPEQLGQHRCIAPRVVRKPYARGHVLQFAVRPRAVGGPGPLRDAHSDRQHADPPRVPLCEILVAQGILLAQDSHLSVHVEPKPLLGIRVVRSQHPAQYRDQPVAILAEHGPCVHSSRPAFLDRLLKRLELVDVRPAPRQQSDGSFEGFGLLVLPPLESLEQRPELDLLALKELGRRGR